MTDILALLLVAIAALGILLIAIMATRLRALNNQVALKKFRAKTPGVADLLNYAAMIEDGVIVCKNGALMAAWLYRGADDASSTDAQREAVALRINQALKPLGTGWMIHVDAVRRAAPNYPAAYRSAFPDRVSAAVDEERRRYFEGLGTMYEGYFVVTLTYWPPMLAESKFLELMFDDDQEAPDAARRTQMILTKFRADCLHFETRMSAAVQLTRLKARKDVLEDGRTQTFDELLRWLQFCVAGVNQPVVLPKNPMYLDAVIGGKELWGGVVPKIGRKFLQVVAVDGFPMESTPGMLTALAEQQCEYRWSTRYIFMDTHEAVAHLDRYRKKWKQKIRGFMDQMFNLNNGTVNQDAADMVADAEAASAEVNSGLVGQGYLTTTIVLMDEDRQRVETNARAIEKLINRLGFAARVETINTLDAFFGSLPGHGVENVRRPLINTLNLADMLPTSSIWTGGEVAPCPMYPPNSPPLLLGVTHGATAFRFNLHMRDLGHTFIFGPTRAGKSTLLGLIALQFLRYPSMTIFAFDKGGSMYPTTMAVGGEHYTIAGEGSALTFCPLQYLETKTDRAWAMEWIDTLLALNGVQTTPDQRNEIGYAIMSMHGSGAKTLSDFTTTLQNVEMREALKQYTIDGMMGHLLDAEEDGLSLSRFTCFEIEHLMNLGEKYALPVLLYLFRRVENSLKGQPAVIIIDEAWLMLGHPVFRDKIREWLKAFAKKNCAVVLATQGLADVAKSAIMDVLVESMATKIYLPNPDAHEESAAVLYGRMGLNSRQIDIVQSAIKQRQYYAVTENGRRLFELALGPLALSFVGATDQDSLARIRQLVKQHGSRWVDVWLSQRRLNLNNYLPATNDRQAVVA
jgi:type IV secretion system protein VirB4